MASTDRLPNKIVINRTIDGLSLHGFAVYVPAHDIWNCIVTDHFGEKEHRQSSDAFAELIDMLDLAISENRERLAGRVA